MSISSVKPVLHLFETSVVAVQEDDLDLTRSIKSKVLGYLQEKYSDPNTQELLDIATSLDPRFKMDYIHEDKKTTIKARLTHEMTGITSVVVIMFTSDHIRLIMIFTHFKLLEKIRYCTLLF